MSNGQEISEIKAKIDEQDDELDDELGIFSDCPRCGQICFHFAGNYQSDDGQYDDYWYCPCCDYTETL